MIAASARLLQLLGLLQDGRSWAGPDLAARLGIETRTLRRDVDRLRALGYPVTALRGSAGGYRLGSGRHLPPLLLDAEEALTVAMGLRSAVLESIAGAEEAAERALHKLHQVLPPEVRAQLAAVSTGLVTVATGTPPVSSADISSVLRACDGQVLLRFDYRSNDGDVTSRDTEPHRLVHAGRRWYVVAYDRERSDWRTFRVDRMTALTASTFTFTARTPPLDAAEFVSRAVSSAPYRYQARIEVDLPPERLGELVPPTVGAVLPLGAASSLLLTGSDSLDSLALHLVWLRCPFRVLEPAELVDHLADLAERLHAAHRRAIDDQTQRSASEPAVVVHGPAGVPLAADHRDDDDHQTGDAPAEHGQRRERPHVQRR